MCKKYKKKEKIMSSKEEFLYKENKDKIHRIAIIGAPGSGKSTLAENLKRVFDLPVYHLDSIHYKENFELRDTQERNQMILDLAKKDEWILDGTFIDTLTDRLDRADYIIDLKYSTWTHLKGIFARKIDENKRNDIPKMTLSFAYYVYSYNNVQRPYIDAILKMYDPGKIITFNSRKVLDEYTKTMFIEMGIPISEIKN